MAMTTNEVNARLVVLGSEAEALVNQYNELFQNGKFKEASDVDAKVQEKVNEYNLIARNFIFDRIIESENSMKTAVTMLKYKSAIAVKDGKTDDEEKVPVRTIVQVEKTINLNALAKYAKEHGGKTVGHDEKWPHMVQKLNFLLCAKVCTEIGVPTPDGKLKPINPEQVNSSFAMSEIAREIDMGGTPTSKTQLLSQLQKIITAMLGDGFKATSHDVGFLVNAYTRKSAKALTLACANNSQMTNLCAEICHRIVTEAAYSAIYKHAKVKEEKPAASTTEENKPATTTDTPENAPEAEQPAITADAPEAEQPTASTTEENTAA